MIKQTRKKLIVKILLISLFVLLINSVVLADSGCFLDRNSDYYCQEIDVADAKFECSILDDCNFVSVFVEDKSCKYFEECEEVLCKSDCEETYLGLCTSGEVPESEENSWCGTSTEGCCQYLSNSDIPSCEVSSNKWECNVVASNAGSENLNWNKGLIGTCEVECQGVSLDDFSSMLNEKVSLEGSDVNYYSDYASSNNMDSNNVDSNDMSSSSTDSNNQDLDVSKINSNEVKTNNNSDLDLKTLLKTILYPIFLLLIIGLIVVFFYEHRFALQKDLKLFYDKLMQVFVAKKETKSKKLEDKEIDKRISSNTEQTNDFDDLFSPTERKHHPLHDKKHQAELLMAESFAEYKPAKLTPKTGMDKLAHLVKRFDRKKQRVEKSRKKLDKSLK